MNKINMEEFAKNLFMGQPKDDEKGLDKDSLLHKLQDERDMLKKELKRFKGAYVLLIDYLHYIPDDAMTKLHKELDKIGL